MSTRWSRAIIITPRADGADGISAVTRLYAQALSAQIGRGIRSLEIWALDADPRPVRMADVPVFVRCADGRRGRFAAYGLTPRVDKQTLVIVQHAHMLPVALPLAWRGARVVLLLHGVEAWKPLRLFERAGCRAAWKIVAVSAHTAARFRAANPAFADSKVEVCHSAIPPLPAAASAGMSAPYALIVGRMASRERYKGHDDVLDVWPRVARAVPGAKLVIVGDGNDRPRLAEKAAGLGLNGDVRFEGVVGAERLAALYRDASVFVMPSPHEGFGLVYVEAMSAGVPCIVATGAAEEIVEHGATGMVVPPGDAAALEQAIVRLLSSRDERNRMGAAAAETVRRRFSAAAFAGRVYDLLDLPELHTAC